MLSFKKLQSDSHSAAFVVRLMMACNDMQLANESLTNWGKVTSPALKDRKFGAQIYFIRLQFSHLYEAMDIIQSIHNDTTLMKLIGRCDATTQASFSYLLDYIKRPKGKRRDWFERHVGRMRNNVAFHYAESGKEIIGAVGRISAKGYLGSVTRADHAHDWHFEPSDLIINNIVCREIWGITATDPLPDSNHIVDQVHEVFLKFIDFAGELIWKYTER